MKFVASVDGEGQIWELPSQDIFRRQRSALIDLGTIWNREIGSYLHSIPDREFYTKTVGIFVYATALSDFDSILRKISMNDRFNLVGAGG